MFHRFQNQVFRCSEHFRRGGHDTPPHIFIWIQTFPMYQYPYNCPYFRKFPETFPEISGNHFQQFPEIFFRKFPEKCSLSKVFSLRNFCLKRMRVLTLQRTSGIRSGDQTTFTGTRSGNFRLQIKTRNVCL